MARSLSARSLPGDPTVYPISDNMGEPFLETFLRLVLLPLVARHLAARGTPQFVGANQFIYWAQFEPTRSVAPDLYVVPTLPPDAQPEAILTWQGGHVPSFALEIVSKRKRKDYEIAPERYDELGVNELIIYDPKARRRRAGSGVTWQVYRRVRRRWVQVERSNEDRVHSVVLGCHLRLVAEGPLLAVRLATGPRGETLVMSEAEHAYAEVERAREAERQASASAERERGARLEAEAEVARLRALLASRPLS